jgi:hypothetical protein
MLFSTRLTNSLCKWVVLVLTISFLTFPQQPRICGCGDFWSPA